MEFSFNLLDDDSLRESDDVEMSETEFEGEEKTNEREETGRSLDGIHILENIQ